MIDSRTIGETTIYIDNLSAQNEPYIQDTNENEFSENQQFFGTTGL